MSGMALSVGATEDLWSYELAADGAGDQVYQFRDVELTIHRQFSTFPQKGVCLLTTNTIISLLQDYQNDSAEACEQILECMMPLVKTYAGKIHCMDHEDAIQESRCTKKA